MAVLLTIDTVFSQIVALQDEKGSDNKYIRQPEHFQAAFNLIKISTS